MRKLGRLADARNDSDLVRLEAELDHGFLEGLEDRKVSAARAPGWDLTAIVVRVSA